MNNFIANQLASYRTRLTCLDRPENTAIWQNKNPVKFTEKVASIRDAMQRLELTAARQSATGTGTAADKAREERELEDAAFTLARAVVAFTTDKENLTLAHKYDFPISHWRQLANEPLLQSALLLRKDAAELAALGQSAADYGITPDAVDALQKEVDDYARCIAAPQDATADRSALTESLPVQSRAIASLFGQLDDLLPQFRKAPGGPEFIESYRASTRIIQRGHRSASPVSPPAPTPSPASERPSPPPV